MVIEVDLLCFFLKLLHLDLDPDLGYFPCMMVRTGNAPALLIRVDLNNLERSVILTMCIIK